MSEYLGEREDKLAQLRFAQQTIIAKPTSRSSSKRIAAIFSGATLAIGIFLALESQRQKVDSVAVGAEDHSVIVHVGRAYQGDMGVYIDALGTVTPISTVNIYSQVSGRVLMVHYREGQIVHRGDPLLDIDPRPYQAQLQQAEGLLDHDRGVLKQAEIDLARYREAFTLHAVAKQILDDQEQAVVQDQGAVKFDLGQVQYAEAQLSYCHITAPTSGRVGLRLVDSGNTVFAGSSSALLVITQLQPITVVFNVAEDHLGEVQTQLRQHKLLAVEAFDRSAVTKLAVGSLLTIDNQVDTSSGTVRFRGEFDNRDLTLFPNQFVNARLLVKTLKGSVLIPSAAIQRNGTQAFVFAVDKNTVSVRNITERSTDGVTAAVEGLQVGETVALSSFDKLQEGTPVKVEPSPQKASVNTGVQP
ncbi:efflux RND transporter periplasmic adaptor subunit [Edaphobacter aggregans]|uniref:efflux RND transporter periplasmic adaptor subunit n=1 Tax=Edaphobacter aggregans TaxID=570835 RepID=UPI00068B737C|nr:efflux RND transporter periplasmic adaptor subunit [Edaphobacter aggregans]